MEERREERRETGQHPKAKGSPQAFRSLPPRTQGARLNDEMPWHPHTHIWPATKATLKSGGQLEDVGRLLG